jgi:hypothetical protein
MVTEDRFLLLSKGELVVTGRLVDASNATLFASLTFEDQSMNAIYKPVAGERPLWDFPDGALADREYAAFLVSEYLGLGVVPLTVLRDGPYGEGMVQEWIDIDESIDLGSFFSTDNADLRAMAFFDAIINNTDRKIGHLLPTASGNLYGCDHGVTFHADDKLRTVLWQWAGDSLTDAELLLLNKLSTGLDVDLDLSPHLTSLEIAAIKNRVSRLIAQAAMPQPNPNWPAVPWPAF